MPNAPRTPTSTADNSSLDVSKAKIGFLRGHKPRFADETAGLLRKRLKAVALVLSIVLALAFIGNLFSRGAPLLGVRATILVVFVGSFFALRSRLVLSLSQLRLFELAIFGGIAVQLLLMMYLRVSLFAVEGDAVSAVAARHLFLSAWSIITLTYGIFMPNTWKRAAAVLLPAACLPYLTLLLLHWRVEEVGTALSADNMGSSVPLPFVAVLVAVYGTHIINSVRREAFKARQFGQYHLKGKLGAGGMGEVHRAEHRMLKRPCAIKLIRPESEADARAITRFEREVRSMAKLSHWNTVEIFDYGRTEDGAFYYVMELLPGLSLEDLVKQHGPLPPERAIHFLRQTCSALREAHSIGLIHRDIKPANIFAAIRGSVYDVTKLLDFGLVKQASADGPIYQTMTPVGGFSGSPLYMAPEQAAAYEKADARCDIYSLGAVTYFLLTGQPPFSGNNPIEVLLAHAQRDVVPPSQMGASAPPDLEQVLLRCLAKDPDQRYQDIESLDRARASCACAGQWSDEKAADWWRQNQDRRTGQQRATPVSQNASKTEHIIDETIEVNSDSADGE